MRRLVALFSGLAGAVALARLLRRPTAGPAPEAQPPGLDPRAEALRRRLDEARAVVDDQDDFDAAEVPVDRAEPAPVDPAALRAEVHEAARASAESMRRRTET